MKFSELSRFQPRSHQNIFVFVCPDEFLIEESRPVWRSRLTGEWIVEKLHAKEFEEIEPSRLTDDALTPSLFSQNRLLLVSNAEKITKRRVEDLVAIQEVANSSLKVVLILSGKSSEILLKSFP